MAIASKLPRSTAEAVRELPMIEQMLAANGAVEVVLLVLLVGMFGSYVWYRRRQA
jgi:hypothetical protein